MKYCKNCKYNNVWGTKVPFGWKLMFPLVSGSKFSDKCFQDVVSEKTSYGSKEEGGETKKVVRNPEGNCDVYKRKWWKFWVNP